MQGYTHNSSIFHIPWLLSFLPSYKQYFLNAQHSSSLFLYILSHSDNFLVLSFSRKASYKSHHQASPSVYTYNTVTLSQGVKRDIVNFYYCIINIIHSHHHSHRHHPQQQASFSSCTTSDLNAVTRQLILVCWGNWNGKWMGWLARGDGERNRNGWRRHWDDDVILFFISIPPRHSPLLLSE